MKRRKFSVLLLPALLTSIAIQIQQGAGEPVYRFSTTDAIGDLHSKDDILQSFWHSRSLLQAETPRSSGVVIANVLPPTPDPSQFTFNRQVINEGAGNNAGLELTLRLIGGTLLPFNDMKQEAVTMSLQGLLDSSIGANGSTVTSPTILQQTAGDSSTANLDTVVLQVTILANSSELQRLADPLQSQIQNAQLAGEMRQKGLYNLQRLSVDSYSVEAEAPAVAFAPAARSGAPSQPSNAPTARAPAPQPATSPSALVISPAPAPVAAVIAPSPRPAAAPVSLALAPMPSPQVAVRTAPVPAPASLLAVHDVPAPEPASSLIRPPAPAPAVHSPQPAAARLAPAPETVHSPAQPTQPPRPAPQPAEAPKIATSNSPAPTPDLSLSQPPVPATPPPAAPVPAPKTQPPAVELAREGLAPSPSPSPSPASSVSFNVNLEGVNGLSQAGMAQLQSALATVLGQDTSSIRLGQPVVGSSSATGRRRLLQTGTTVPVQVNTNNPGQLEQQLASLGSGNVSALTQQLASAGIPVTGVTIRDSNGQQYNVTPASSSPNSPANVPASKKGASTGAVVGGIVGGIVGALLLVGVAACCFGRYRASRIRKRFPAKASHGTKLGSEYTPPQGGSQIYNPVFGKEPTAMTSPESSPLAPGPSVAEPQVQPRLLSTRDLMQFNTPPGSARAYAKHPDPAFQMPQGEQGMTLRDQGAFRGETGLVERPESEASSDKSYYSAPNAGHRETVMRLVGSGSPLAGRYIIGADAVQSAYCMVLLAKDTTTNRPCLCKFVFSQNQEVLDNEAAVMNIFPAPSPVPDLMEVIPAGALEPDLPSCFVSATGDWNLSQWLQSSTRQSETAKRTVALFIARSLVRVHEQGYVHGNLSPDNIFYSKRDSHVKLASFSLWAKSGRQIPLHPAFRYVSPEAVAANRQGQRTMQASPLIDSWALGIILLEIFGSGPKLAALDVRDAQSEQSKISEMLGTAPLPWERDPTFFDCVSDINARSVIPHLLRRDVASRWTVSGLLESKLFSGIGLEIADPAASLELASPMLAMRPDESVAQGIQNVISPGSAAEEAGIAEVSQLSSLNPLRDEPLRTSPSSYTTDKVELVTEKVETRSSRRTSLVPPQQAFAETSRIASGSLPGDALTDFDSPRLAGILSEDEAAALPSTSASSPQAGPSRSSGNPFVSSLATQPSRLQSSRWEQEKQEVEQLALHRILYSELPNLRGSALCMSVLMERVVGETEGLSESQILQGIRDGSLQTVEAPMVVSRASPPEKPVFLIQGGKLIIKVRLAAGSIRGWVPLMISQPAQVGISVGRKGNEQMLQFRESSMDVSKWEGLVLWDASSPQVTKAAGKHGQMTRLYLTLDCFAKNSSNVLTLEDDLIATMLPRGYRVPSNMSWTPNADVQNAVKDLPWAQEAFKGSASFNQVTYLSAAQQS